MNSSSSSSSGSRGTRPSGSRLHRFKRKLLSSLFCAGSVSRPHGQMDDHMDESLAGSLENLAPRYSEPASSVHHLSSTYDSSTETRVSSSRTVTGASSGRGDGDMSPEFGLSNCNKSRELGSQRVSGSDSHLDGPGSSEVSPREPIQTASLDANTMSASIVGQSNENLHAAGESSGDGSHDSFAVNSGSDGSGSRVTSQPDQGFMFSDGEQELTGASVLFVDLVNINSNSLPSDLAEITGLEARRNSRRTFWDAFSRSSSGQSRDSPTIIVATSHADDLWSHDRWLLDFSGDLLYDGFGRASRHSDLRSRHRRERRWQSRYEDSDRFRDVRDRFHDVRDRQSWQTSLCSTGLHPRGTCSCEHSFGTAEEASRGARFSQIVMLADALFEVLEEIHRHRVSFSPSMLSLPAPEAIVDSFPLKDHKKPCKTENGSHDAEQCHICLVDYEEGDKIRVLPCSHEYHMLCVDKWLKEIHGVCPLCRDDVCKGANDGSASTQ
ncbi:hypothetical protein Tsubulata_002762 [Turnera subulata]|uniref:RING-type domain-containing protein n=1 Tax=Turnera subulata TaxID=218843 RepID=A0A9Q0JMZ0_9ROSI|nr:hypothetical protein Tsubulata_002762 [Turnera subulata]